MRVSSTSEYKTPHNNSNQTWGHMTANIVKEIRLTPQAKTILRHLETRGSISPMEAQIAYSITRLAACIYEIRKSGHAVNAVIKYDEARHKYTKYALARKAA